jgi:hypothetical protein
MEYSFKNYAKRPNIKNNSTQWASRANAVSELKYHNIKRALIKISMSKIEKPMVNLDAKKWQHILMIMKRLY